MLWTRNGKIIAKDGKIVDCDECPCGDLCFKIVLYGTDIHEYDTVMSSRHTFIIRTNLAEIYEMTAFDGDRTEVTIQSLSHDGGAIEVVFVNKGGGGALCNKTTCENTFNVVIKMKAKPNGKFRIDNIDHDFSGCVSSTYGVTLGKSDCCEFENMCFYGGGMEKIPTPHPAEHPSKLVCSIEAKPYAQKVYAVGHVDDNLKWINGGWSGGEEYIGDHDVRGSLFTVSPGESAEVYVKDELWEVFGFDGYIIVSKDGCNLYLPELPWGEYEYGNTYHWDLSRTGCGGSDEDEFE